MYFMLKIMDFKNYSDANQETIVNILTDPDFEPARKYSESLRATEEKYYQMNRDKLIEKSKKYYHIKKLKNQIILTCVQLYLLLYFF